MMKSVVRGVVGAVKNIRTRSSSRHTSVAGSDMSTDPPPVTPPPASSSAPRRVLLRVLRASDLGLRNSRERAIYRKLKTKIFSHTPVLDPTLLVEAGMADEFDIIFSLVGWTAFANITS
jgi:hypothetical protein